MPTISQKRFVKGLNAATGVLSQQPGSLTRMSNLLLTQRGSLQVCDGSAWVGESTLPVPYRMMRWIDAFQNFSVGQFPYYSVLSQATGPVFANVTGVTASISGSATNPAGIYFLAVVATGSSGGQDHTSVASLGAFYQLNAG